MSQRNTRLAGGLVLCVLLGAGLGYGLGWLFPVPDRPSYFGIVVDTATTTTSSEATKNDSDLLTTLVPDMSIEVYPGGLDFLIVEFSAMAYLYLDASFQGLIRFNISLNVDNVSRCNALVYQYSAAAIGTAETRPMAVHMKWISPVMPQGSHGIDVTWSSLTDVAGLNYLTFSRVTVNMTRTLSVLVIRS